MKKIKSDRYQSKLPQNERYNAEKRIKQRLAKLIKNEYEYNYGRKVINDIIFNENSKLVANFKDFLIYGDNTDFLKRYIDILTY